jgi:hypothetical protein
MDDETTYSNSFHSSMTSRTLLCLRLFQNKRVPAIAIERTLDDIAIQRVGMLMGFCDAEAHAL